MMLAAIDYLSLSLLWCLMKIGYYSSLLEKQTFIIVALYPRSMNLNSLLSQEEPDKITFHDKLSLIVLVIGAIFLGMIVLSLTLNLLDFETMEFNMPFG